MKEMGLEVVNSKGNEVRISDYLEGDAKQRTIEKQGKAKRELQKLYWDLKDGNEL